MLQRFCFVLCFFLIAICLKAQKVTIGPEPLWLYKIKADLSKMPDAKSVSDGYYLELVDRQTSLFAHTVYTHYIRHIVNESGVQNASEVSVTFDPQFQRVVYHKIALMRNGKQINTFSQREIQVVQEETDAQDFQYNGAKRAFVLLKDVRKGDRIEVAYSLIGFNPVFGDKYHTHIYFEQDNTIVNYAETIIAPKDRILRFKYFNGAPVVKEINEGNSRIYYWDNPSRGYWEDQPGVPQWFNNYFFVTVTEYNNWKEVVDGALTVFNYYNHSLPADILGKMAGWRLKANGNKDIFARYAIRFVQDEIRYLGLEMGPNTHKPHPPGQVCQARYGDCKDKALLLATILRKENIPAYVALVSTTDREKLSDAAPNFGEFDHAIVAIERSPGYIFVDATIANQRGDLLDIYIPAYGKALVVKEGEDKLQPVKPGPLKSTDITETLYAHFNDKGESSFEVSTSYKGGAADDIRASFAENSIRDIEEGYVKYYEKVFEGIKQVQDISYQDDSLENRIEVNEKYSIPALWKHNKKEKDVLSTHARPIDDRLPDPSTSYKDAPLALSYPMDISYSLILHMPEEWSFVFDPLKIKNDSYEFSFEPLVIGNMIRLEYHLKTFKDHIPESGLKAYKEDYRKIQDILNFDLSISRELSDRKADNVQALKDINWASILYTFLLAGILFFLFSHFNKKTANIVSSSEPAWPLGGWIILLGITLVVGVFVQLIYFFKINYFALSSINTLGNDGGFKLQMLLYIELTVSVAWITMSIAMIYWFFKRRDIFPAMFLWYVGALLAGRILLVIAYSIIPYPASYGNLVKDSLTELVRTCIYAAIWGTYIVRSERVRYTFLKEYK